MRLPWLLCGGSLCVPCVSLCRGAAQLHAQPDPRQMAGIPRPVDDLPSGSVSVRLIRGALTNNIPNQPVELQVGRTSRPCRTDEQGRAQFDKLPAGATLKAVGIVDGERLESEPFPAPAQGGIRLLLVATDRAADRRPARPARRCRRSPATSPSAGRRGSSSSPATRMSRVYYLLDIVNNSARAGEPGDAVRVRHAGGLHRHAASCRGRRRWPAVNGPRVIVSGPFPPGRTFVQVGAQICRPRAR